MNQKGAALAYAILALAIGSGFVALVTTSLSNQQTEQKLFQKQMSRDAVARNVAEGITNPLNLLASIAVGVNLPGNTMLRNCLGSNGSTATLNTSTNTVSGNACNTVGIDPTLGWEFLLFSQDNRFAGTPSGQSNCPAPGMTTPWSGRSLSCFIAGNRNGLYVAYNFKGDTNAQVDSNFPLTAKAFFKPVCRSSNPAQTSCQFAEAIDVRYEIIETVAAPGEKFKLGTYPSKPQWVRMNSISIFGMQCNPGAIASANEATGLFECICFRPYFPEMSGGQPVVNSKGPLCLTTKACPTGMVLEGHDADSNPICGTMVTSVVVSPGDSFSTTDPPIKHSCNINNNGGWVSNVTRTCFSDYTLSYMECPEGCSREIWPMIVGAIIGLLVAILVLNVVVNIMYSSVLLAPIAAAIDESVLAPLIVTLIILAGVAAGAGLGAALSGKPTDWLYLDKVHGKTPDIHCDISMSCGNIK